MSTMVRRFTIAALGCVALASSAAAVQAACLPATGKFTEFILPQGSAPNDPAGRVVGNVDGTFKGATTAFISGIQPELNGGLHVTTVNSFATEEGNQLFMRGDGHWEFLQNGFYQVQLTLTIIGGAGKYAKASGTIKTLGIGNNVGPGRGAFIQEYTGQVCTP